MHRILLAGIAALALTAGSAMAQTPPAPPAAGAPAPGAQPPAPPPPPGPQAGMPGAPPNPMAAAMQAFGHMGGPMGGPAGWHHPGYGYGEEEGGYGMRRMRHMRPMMPPPPPPSAVFEIHHGDTDIQIHCAPNETMRACVDAATSILDKLPAPAKP